MSVWNTVQVGSFLDEREDRFEPDEANKLGFKRLYKIDFSGKVHLLDDKQTNTGMILVKKGDLVISGINVEKGAIAVYQGEEDVLATIHYSSYKFDKSKIDVGYFTWFLRSQTFKDVVQSQVRGGIKTELKSKHFLPLKINLPDLPIQQEIKKRINNVSNEIKEINELEVRNEDYVIKLRQSILQEAVQGKLIPQDSNDEPASILLEEIKAEKEKLIREKKIRKEKPLPAIKEDEIPYQLPQGWMWMRLGDISFKVQDGTHFSPKKQYLEKSSNRLLYLTSKNVKDEGIDLRKSTYIDEELHHKIYERCNPEYGDLLMIKDGAITGRVTINNIEEPFSLLSSVALIKTNNWIDNRYLMYYLRSPVGFENVTGRMSGSAITRIILERIKKTIIPLPPLNEQKRIVEKVDQLMKLCDELEEKVQENQTNTDLLMEAVLREAFEVKAQ